MTVAQPDIREVRRTDTVARLLDAAWAIARDRGVGALSLRELARAVGIRQPSLYTYFESKNGLYNLMFLVGNQELLARATAIEPSGDPVADLRATACVLAEFATEDVGRYELMFRRPIPGFEPSAEACEPAKRFLELLVRRVEAVGITAPDDVDIVVAGIAGLIDAQIAGAPTGDRWIGRLDRLLDTLRAGLAGDSRTAPGSATS